MSNNHVQPGRVLDFVATEDLVGGQGLLIQDVFGIVSGAALVGEDASMDLEEVWEHAKEGVAVTQFENAFWDDTAKVVTNDATGNKRIGVFTEDAAIGDAIAKFRLNGFTV